MGVLEVLIILLMSMLFLIAFVLLLYMIFYIIGYTSVIIEDITDKENKISKCFKKICDM